MAHDTYKKEPSPTDLPRNGGTRNPVHDKRGERRLTLETPVILEFISPTETWRPSVQIGTSIDVSLRGTKVFLGELSGAVYNRLLHDYRRVVLKFKCPDSGEMIVVPGQIVWIDYHKQAATEQSGPCYLGVFFDKADAHAHSQYRRLILSLSDQPGPQAEP
jgi:hypothetical protein